MIDLPEIEKSFDRIEELPGYEGQLEALGPWAYEHGRGLIDELKDLRGELRRARQRLDKVLELKKAVGSE